MKARSPLFDGQIRRLAQAGVRGAAQGEDRGDQRDDCVDDVGGGAAVGGLGPLFRGTVDGPTGCGRNHLGGDDCAGLVFCQAFEEHAADYGDDGRLHMGRHLAGFG